MLRKKKKTEKEEGTGNQGQRGRQKGEKVE